MAMCGAKLCAHATADEETRLLLPSSFTTPTSAFLIVLMKLSIIGVPLGLYEVLYTHRIASLYRGSTRIDLEGQSDSKRTKDVAGDQQFTMGRVVEDTEG